MEPHTFPVSEAERPRLLPDRVRHAHATEVAHERGATHERHGSRRQAQAPGGSLRELCHCRRMLAEPRRLQTREGGDGREAGVDPLAREPNVRERLRRQCLLPHACLVQLVEEVGEVPHGEPSEPRVVGGTRTTLDHGPGLVRPRGREEEGDVPRHVQQTHRQGDLVAADVWKPTAVPAREDVLERCLDVRAEVEPTRRTAAPPRTSSRTPHGPAGLRWRSLPRRARREPPAVGPPRWWPGRTRAPPRGWSCRSGRRRLGTRCRRRTPALPRARWTCTRRRGAARRSRCRRALGSTLRRARRAAPRARRCAMRARAADRCPDRSRATGPRPPRQRGSSARRTATGLRLLRGPPPRRDPTPFARERTLRGVERDVACLHAVDMACASL